MPNIFGRIEPSGSFYPCGACKQRAEVVLKKKEPNYDIAPVSGDYPDSLFLFHFSPFFHLSPI